MRSQVNLRFHRGTFWLRYLVCVGTVCLADAVFGQLRVLSPGDPVVAWRTAQLDSLKSQTANPSLPEELKLELKAQSQWLVQWKPGELNSRSMVFPDSGNQKRALTEPTIDPSGKAGGLRTRLFGPGARPTAKDTDALRTALQEFGKDLGLRQLHVHWLDQPQYRESFRVEIIQACDLLIQLLANQSETEELKLVRAYVHLRRSRVVMGNELVSDLAVYGKIRSDYEEIIRLVGRDRTEFAILEIAMLCSNGWYGRSLVMLEQSASSLSVPDFHRFRLQLLKSLQWPAAANEQQQVVTQLTRPTSGS